MAGLARWAAWAAVVGLAASGLTVGCTNVAQMHQAYEAGDESQLDNLLEIAGRADYPYATRKEAAKALGAIGDVRAVPVLVGILRQYDRRTTLKEEALIALGRIGDRDAAVPIGHLLDRSLSAPNAELRLAALNVLGQLGGEESAEVLVNAMRYYDMLMVRSDQGRMRGVFSGDEAVVRALRDSVRTPIQEQPVVGAYPGEPGATTSMFGTAMDFVPEAIHDTTPEERRMAHSALVRVGAEAVPTISEFMEVEQLTNTLERELQEILGEIEARGS